MHAHTGVVYIYIYACSGEGSALQCIHYRTSGKAVGLYVCRRHTKITRSHFLGICACCKHNQSVDISKKLVCIRFELLKNAY